MMLVVHTQVYENYGYRWKPKGGSSYKITGVPLNIDYDAVIAVANIEQKNDHFEETVIGWTIENDDWMSEFEQSQLEYEGEIRYPEPTLEYGDLVAQYAE